MNVTKVVEELNNKYPGKKIIVNTPEDPQEIVCEVEPASGHPEWSLAIAVVGKSQPNYHNKTEVTYEVIKGKLALYLNNKKKNLM